jgi:hypothetical protein
VLLNVYVWGGQSRVCDQLVFDDGAAVLLLCPLLKHVLLVVIGRQRICLLSAVGSDKCTCCWLMCAWTVCEHMPTSSGESDGRHCSHTQ